jgi:DNA repair protein RadC
MVALKGNACNIIVAHNHHSSNTKPSKADEELTLKIKEAGKLLDIKLLDHLIITEEGYFSFADEGII